MRCLKALCGQAWEQTGCNAVKGMAWERQDQSDENVDNTIYIYICIYIINMYIYIYGMLKNARITLTI